MISHLVLCAGCGYSFWTVEDPDYLTGHCSLPYDPMRSDYAGSSYRWLVDEEAIDWIANRGMEKVLKMSDRQVAERIPFRSDTM
jgi:hypothetical protein